ncbi:MAG: prepilin-type N-terminal cleavage/methylation domain-containing protein [Candidatus Auribacterota bacterium]|jgi:prepilin-type processing-associated H-X9-DG protein|nr:prepilin-type N-terminal cleavage/methylation domain-containing protein [Candidatus Auribacterota bacterium]
MIGHKRAFCSGMTLPELLAAVCVLIVLIGILTSGLKSMYQKVEAVQCTNNLRQIGMAIQLYIADHDYFLPTPGRMGGKTWARKLIDQEYLKETKMFSCPALPAKRTYRINSGYYNGSVWEHADTGDGGARDVSTIQQPGSTILISEYMNASMTTDIDTNNTDAYSDTTMWGGNYPSTATDSLLSVHNGGSNYLFVDFHVEWIERKEILNDPKDLMYYDKP